MIPKGSTIVINILGMGRNGNIWKNPEIFDPERFEPENFSKLRPFSWIPFSGGPRNCIGQKFAMLQIKSTISKVLRHFEIIPEPDFEPILQPIVVLNSSNGIILRLKSRRQT